MAENNIKIPADVKDFAKANFKKFKKKEGDYYDSKKELKKGYYYYLLELLPKTIEFLVKFGYLKEVSDVKDACFDKFTDEDFIKLIKKEVKAGNKIENLKIYPILIAEMLNVINKQNAEILQQNPNANIYTGNDLIELSKLILKKKLKKFEKNEIDESIAFDVLSIIPDDSVLGRSAPHRFASLCRILNEHAKTKTINFEKIVSLLMREDYYAALVRFVLLERKEVFGRLTDKQKEYYLTVSTWAFNTFENLDNNAIKVVLDTYIQARKRDDGQGKDAPRRYALTSLSETDYPRIYKAVNKKIAENENNKKYLG